MIVLAAQASWANPKGMSESDRRFWDRKPYRTPAQIVKDRKRRQDASHFAVSSAFESYRPKH